jgi:hypothetical protein
MSAAHDFSNSTRSLIRRLSARSRAESKLMKLSLFIGSARHFGDIIVGKTMSVFEKVSLASVSSLVVVRPRKSGDLLSRRADCSTACWTTL